MPNVSLYTTSQVRAIDQSATRDAGVSGFELMQRAAAAVWRETVARWPHARRMVVLAGPGNNGGDGFLLACLAREAGVDVTMLALHDQCSGDAAKARESWLGASGRLAGELTPATLSGADVVVDALFGSGLSRPPEGRAAEWIRQMNEGPAPVIAVDVPSGLDADTGHAGGAVVNASATVCLVAWKRGLFTGVGREASGELLLDRLGLPAALFERVEHDGELISWPGFLPRQRHAHKGMAGRVLVIGGDHGMAGAARLAGEAALRCGAGLVEIGSREAHLSAILAGRPELMVSAVAGDGRCDALLARADVLALGPGLGRGDWGRACFAACMASDLPLVLDADGLRQLADSPVDLEGRAVILTPHPGEAARLAGCDIADIERDRFAAARGLAKQYRAVVVLKGSGTLVAAPDGRMALCRHGNPGMASGGMGDVLTGVAAAMLAQGLAPWQAACAAVDAHARAGDLAAGDNERGLLASDLFARLRHVVNGNG